MTTCQICGRDIKAKHGVIAHHGYQRPGSGWQTESCFGARRPPYEVSCDAIPDAIESYQRIFDKISKTFNEWKASPPHEITVYVTDTRPGKGRQSVAKSFPRPEGFDQGKPSQYGYERFFHEKQYKRERSLAEINADIATLRKRLKDWKPPHPAAA